MLVVTLLACAPPPVLAGPDRIEAEPTLSARITLTVGNPGGRPLALEAAGFEPGDARVRVEYAGDGAVPGRSTDVLDVVFFPDVVGTWSETLLVQTDRALLAHPLDLVAAIGVDDDADGFSIAMGDCDDTDPEAFPDAEEACDGVDQDCDGVADDGFDRDGDGHLDLACPGGDDCDDRNRAAWPGATEVCDLVDNDCNGVRDDIAELADRQEGVCAGTRKVCSRGAPIEPDYTTVADYQAAEARCDGLDNDCDGVVDDFDRDGDGTSDCVDDDGDGASEAEGDCADGDPAVGPDDCGPRRLLVTSFSDGLVVLDLNLDAEVARFGTGGPRYAALGLGDLAVVTDRTAVLRTTDLVTGEDVDSTTVPGPTWSLVDGGGTIWLRTGDGAISEVRPSPLDVGARIRAGADGTGLAVDPDTGLLWACDATGGVHRVDPDTGDVESLATTADCFAPPVIAGDRVLVLGYTANTLVVIDRAAFTVTDTVAVPHRALRGALGAGALYIATGVDDTVEVYDPDTLERRATWEMGAQTTDVWVDAARGRVWAAVLGADEIREVDLDGDPVGAWRLVRPFLLNPSR